MHLKTYFYSSILCIVNGKVAKGIWFAQVSHPRPLQFSYALSFSFPISVSPPKAQFQISFLWPPSHVFECLLCFSLLLSQFFNPIRIPNPVTPKCALSIFSGSSSSRLEYAVSCLTKYTMKSAFHCALLWYWYCVPSP